MEDVFCTTASPGLLAWWPLNENEGTRAADLVQGLDATLQGESMPGAEGRVGGAVSLNRSFVEVSSSPVLNFGAGDFSIDIWLRTEQRGGVITIIDKRRVDEAVVGYSLFLFNGNLSFQLADGMHTNFSSDIFVADGEWHHLAVTVDRDREGSFYLDGVLRDTFDPTEHMGSLDNDLPLRFGALSTGNSGVLSGTIDEVALYNRELSPMEIAAVHQAGPWGRCPELNRDIKPIQLQSRAVEPEEGVAPELVESVAAAWQEGRTRFFLIAQLTAPIQSDFLPRLERDGVRSAVYLHDTNWILGLDLIEDVSAMLMKVRRVTGARALTSLLPTDKASAETIEGVFESWVADENGLLTMTVSFFPQTPEDAIQALLSTVHVGAGEPEQVGPNVWVVSIQNDAVATIIADGDVVFLEPGPRPAEPLMDDARLAIGADAVQRIDPLAVAQPVTYNGYTGKDIRLSNSEGLLKNHPDFKDNNGQDRWLSGVSSGDNHGAMTAGIIMGNGAHSAGVDDNGNPNGGRPFQYRGIAPEAIMDIYFNDPDVSNFSFIYSRQYTSGAAGLDNSIRGDYLVGGKQRFFLPHVYGAGNEGLVHQYGDPDDIGYYSLWNVAKNKINVGNISDEDLGFQGSSIGPTLDGRTKPDVVAPGTKHIYPDIAEVAVEIDRVQLILNKAIQMEWNFDTLGTGWTQGWTEEPWWTIRHIGPVTQHPVSPGIYALRFPLIPHQAKNGLVGTIEDPAGLPLNIKGSVNHKISIRYRVTEVPRWNRPTAGARLRWAPNDHTVYTNYKDLDFPVITDGNYHEAVIDLSNVPDWHNAPGSIKILQIVPIGVPPSQMKVPRAGKSYGGAGGSSASAPVVTGSIAVLIDQLKRDYGVIPGDHSPSPFWTGAGGAGNGVPYPSTFRGLLAHTAKDLAAVPHPRHPDNPDTLEVTNYHKGPDYVTGYGVIQLDEASRLVKEHASATGAYIIENELSAGLHAYQIQVPASPARPLKVTLAWDDPGHTAIINQQTSVLDNDLRLVVLDPDSNVKRPWTLTPPTYHKQQGQTNPVDIVPAEQNRDNTIDNLEQVYVENPKPGTWTVLVDVKSWGASGSQKYSLFLGGPAAAAGNLCDGKVTWVSDRTGSNQIYIQEVNQPNTPKKLTTYRSRHPSFSPDGRYIVHIEDDILCGNDVGKLRVMDNNGTVQFADHGLNMPNISARQLGYPQWDKEGKRILFTFWNDWGPGRGLAIAELTGGPYDFSNRTYKVIVPNYADPLLNPDNLRATDAEFSPDGRYIYFHADTPWLSGGLFRVEAGGGIPVRLKGDGFPIHRAFQLSVSTDGKQLLYNSELYRDDPVAFLDEELIHLGLNTGVTRQISKETGNQYANWAVGGRGEFALQSSLTAGSLQNLFLQENGVRMPLDVGGSSSNDHSPSWWKSAPDSADLPKMKTYCTDDPKAVTLTICNGDPNNSHDYTYVFSGTNPGPGQDVPGPGQFIYKDANPITVPAGSCVNVTVEIVMPSGFTSPGQTAGYRVDLRNEDTGYRFSETGGLRYRGTYICPVVVNNPVSSTNLVITNIGGVVFAADYEVNLIPPGDGERYRIGSLNGNEPGVPVTGRLNLEPGASTEIAVDTRFSAYEPNCAFDLVFSIGEGEDGSLVEVDSVPLRTPPLERNIPPTFVFSEPETEQIADKFLVIEWSDEDPDDNAGISLWYGPDMQGSDLVPIVSGLAENPDEGGDRWFWGTESVPEGTWYLYATIQDRLNPVVTVLREQPVIIQRGGQTNLDFNTRWVPHVTRLSADFQTRLIITNTREEAGSLTLHPYLTDGTGLESVTLNLEGGTFQEIATTALFGDQDVSHFSISGDDFLTVTTAYRVADALPGGTAHVQEATGAGTMFSLYEGERDRVWDGLSIINTGTRPATIEGLRYDAAGNQVSHRLIETDLEPYSRKLLAFSSFFEDRPDERVLIRSSEPAYIVFLRGAADNNPGYLYQTESLGVHGDDSPRWLPHITREGAGFDTTLLMTNLGETTCTMRLTPYHRDGSFSPPREFEIPAGGFLNFDSYELFEGLSVSHLFVEGPGICTVTAAYRAAGQAGGSAHVQDTAITGTEFRLQQAEWDTVWDGMAVVNLGNEPALIEGIRYDASGRETFRSTIESDLTPKAKALLDFSTFFEDRPGEQIVIRSSQQSSILFLRGSRDGRYLYRTAPLVTKP
ncbi:MAG: S8 family serine peptidase [Acidobacteriota bacterium]|nr:S8 family serine peptidase [Acidobacteriota bacterium]